jgi:transposase
MIYQTRDDDRWRLERRGPQHAVPPDSSDPLRRHGGRALRLIVTAGAWGAGLCLVIGLVAMVAQAAPSRPARAAERGVADRSTDSRVTDTITSNTAYDGYIRRFSDTGLAFRSFVVAGHSRWQLRWSYRCNTGTRGYLTISEPTISSGVRVQSTGTGGRGITWAFSDAATHFLLIHGSCPWTVTVTGRR